MTTQTTTVGRRASVGESAGPHEAQSVSSRRLKKREIDRRCQRQARERTKTRIAYLEGLVEDFRQQDSSGQVATLMKQLKEVELERDLMSKTLKDIQKAMDTHKPLKPNEDQAQDDTIHLARMAYEEPNVDRKPSIASSTDDDPLAFQSESIDVQAATSPGRNFELANFSPPPSLPLQSQDMLLAPEIVHLESESPQAQVLVQSKPVSDPTLMPSRYADNWAAPRRTCSCKSCHVRRPGHRSVWKGNYWSYANEVLSERFDWTDEITPATDAMSDDVPVRALLEGWDAVAKRGPLHPSWQILRRIDQTLFGTCPNTERLAIMRAMHTLLQFHTQSTAERYAQLPPWYMRRPSQKIAHSYAIDYFAWPGVRERFIFNEHDYCDNEFWRLFSKSIRILWPYEFRDCYTREIETGLYKVSPVFDQRLTDIKCWTMGPDIFHRFPELYSDMPAFSTIHYTPSAPGEMQTNKKRRTLPATPSPKTRHAETAQDEEQEKFKPPPEGGHLVPIDNAHAHHAHGLQAHQQHRPQRHHQQQAPNPHMYNITDFNPIMALDAFAYGAINEADFASVYPPETLEGFPNLIF